MTARRLVLSIAFAFVLAWHVIDFIIGWRHAFIGVL
jgi:hypothetical protein